MLPARSQVIVWIDGQSFINSIIVRLSDAGIRGPVRTGDAH